MIYSEASYGAYHFAHIAARDEFRRLQRIKGQFARQAAPMRSRQRISSDSVWPLRAPDGHTFAERAGQ